MHCTQITNLRSSDFEVDDGNKYALLCLISDYNGAAAGNATFSALEKTSYPQWVASVAEVLKSIDNSVCHNKLVPFLVLLYHNSGTYLSRIQVPL